MKQLIFLFSLCFISISYGQDYPKIVVPGATWVYVEWYYHPLNYYAYHIAGDSLVNDINYAILNKHQVEVDDDGFVEINPNGSPIAFLREDTIGKKLFAIVADIDILPSGVESFEQCFGSANYPDEVLLWDFDLEVGEMISNCDNLEIYKIDSLEKFDCQIRRFSLDGGAPYYEKFGGEYGLLFPPNSGFIAAYGIWAIGYCISDSLDCEIFVGPDVVTNQVEKSIIISPNPTTDFIYIRTEKENIESIKLYSIDGELLYQQDKINIVEIGLDLSSLGLKGTILAVFQTKSGIIVERIVKL